MNKLSAKLGILLIKIILVLACVMFSVLSIAFAGIHVGSAMAFLAVIGTVLTLDSMRK